MKYEDLKLTKFECPACKRKLHSRQSDKDRGIWCGSKNCDTVGANEGAYGKNDKEAYATLCAKIGFGGKK